MHHFSKLSTSHFYNALTLETYLVTEKSKFYFLIIILLLEILCSELN